MIFRFMVVGGGLFGFGFFADCCRFRQRGTSATIPACGHCLPAAAAFTPQEIPPGTSGGGVSVSKGRGVW